MPDNLHPYANKFSDKTVGYYHSIPIPRGRPSFNLGHVLHSQFAQHPQLPLSILPSNPLPFRLLTNRRRRNST